MIRFKDFLPEQTSPGGFLSFGTFEDLQEAMEDANAWIATEQIDVINVETVLLPNIHLKKENVTADTHLPISDGDALWRQFVRIWYREGQ